MIQIILALLLNLGISVNSGGGSGPITVIDTLTGETYSIGTTAGLGNGVVKGGGGLVFYLHQDPDGNYYLTSR
jgi:hypothetical protein